MSSYAGTRGEALPWWAVLVEGIVVALFGLLLLVAPGASLSFLVHIQDRFRAMSYGNEHETSYLRTHAF